MSGQRTIMAIATGTALLVLAGACGGGGAGNDSQPSTLAGMGALPPTSGSAAGTAGLPGVGGEMAGAGATSAGSAAPAPASGGTTGALAGTGAGGMGGTQDAGASGVGGGGGMSGSGGGSAPAVETVATLYWLDINANRVMRTQDFERGETIVARTGTAPDGVAVDVTGGKVYWTNMGSLLGLGGGSLQRANLDGSGVETIIPSGLARTPKQMQLDLVNGHLYFCDREGAKVWRADLDGGNAEAIVSEHGFRELVGVAIDVPHGKFYFSDRIGRKILRANIEMPAGETGADRTDIEEMLVFGAGAMPIDLDIDREHQMLYWTDRQLATVSRAGLELPAGQDPGSRGDVETLVRNVTEAIGISLDVANDKMYYSELGGQVSEAALDGSGARELVRSGSATGVALVHLPK